MPQGLWHLNSLSRDLSWAPALDGQSPGHWTTRDVPGWLLSLQSCACVSLKKKMTHTHNNDKRKAILETNTRLLINYQFSSVQSFRRVWLFRTPWTAAHQASLSIINSPGLPKLMSIESVMRSNHLILCRPLLLLLSIFPGIRVFSNDLALHIRWPKYWSFNTILKHNCGQFLSCILDVDVT